VAPQLRSHAPLTRRARQLDGDDDDGREHKVPKVRWRASRRGGVSLQAAFPLRTSRLCLRFDAPAAQPRRKKDRNAPKRPRNAYLVFLDRHRPAKHAANPQAAMKARRHRRPCMRAWLT